MQDTETIYRRTDRSRSREARAVTIERKGIRRHKYGKVER
jgi:hypothetical protein